MIVMKLIITIPAFNEAETISQVIRSVPKKVKGFDSVQILVWSDGSTDGTREVSKKAGADYVFENKRNLGLARTFDLATRKAVELGADVIVNTDADNQYDQSEIPLLVEPILQGKADVVNGDRQVSTLIHMPKSKKYGNMLGSWVVRLLSGLSMNDASSGFRAYTASSIQSFRIFSRHTYTHETLIQSWYAGLTVLEVPVTFNKRVDQSGQSRLISSVGAHIFKSGVTIFRTTLMFQGMKLFFILGSLELLLSLSIGARYVYLMLTQAGGTGHIQSLILASMLFTFALVTYLVGIIADLISVNRKIMIGW